MKTVIEFRFKKPFGFALVEGKGNFYPALTKVLAKDNPDIDQSRLPNHYGNLWVDGHDYTQVYKVELEDEEPREIPEYIREIEDDATRAAFRVKSAEAAAASHAVNNVVRDELARFVRDGKLEIVSDSFLEKRAAKKAAQTPPEDAPADENTDGEKTEDDGAK